MANDRNAGRKTALGKDDIKRMCERKLAGESATVLAKEYGVSRQTVYGYLAMAEGERLVPVEADDNVNFLCRTLEYWKKINEHIEGVELAELEKYNLKYEYMDGEKLATEILVNFSDKKVRIKNHTDEILNRAFGVNVTPNWQDFNDFIEERCFPKNRDMLKDVLSDYGLSDFDAFRIVEETGGVMAGDRKWIRVIHFTAGATYGKN